MPSGTPSDPKVKIAHVLTMDVVEYSTLLITDQTRVMAELTRIVKNAARSQRADAEGQLIRVPTGDGMVLVFFDDPEAPMECAMETLSTGSRRTSSNTARSYRPLPGGFNLNIFAAIRVMPIYFAEWD